MDVLFDNEAKKRFPGICIATIEILNTKVLETPHWLLEEMRNTVSEIKTKYAETPLTQDPIIVAYRKFFRDLGLDPTKIRPSGEALIRMALKRGRLPIINNIVDSMNVISAKTGISASVFDADKIKGPITVRLANKDEEYVPHGGQKYKTGGGELIISDSVKILCLYPYRDTVLTRITSKTKNIVLQTHGVTGINANLVQRAAEDILKFILKSGGGKASKVFLISS